MRFLPLILLLPMLVACNDPTVDQWIDPDKTFAKLPQPDVPSVNQTLEKSANDALEAGDIKRASQFYKQLLDSDKATAADKMRYRTALADASRRAGDDAGARKLFDEILKDDPSNLDALEGKGLTLMAQGKSAEAGRVLAQVLEKDPKRWRTLNALGILFVTKNMIPEAVEYFTEALKVSPDNSAVLNNVGLARAIEGNFPRAIEALQQAVKMSSTDARRKQVNLNLALVYGISGDMDSAKVVAEKYLEGAALDNNLGLYSHLAKNDELAKTYLNMALTRSPTYYERAWQNLNVITNQSNPDTKANPRGVAPPPSVTN
ncbi:MAG: tetratricopeptide repeat protein [Rickettsiales bacterium]|jgi:Flp pilus assembly protein TadD|nr:tetratricopeptide repeat protein [Rickettsiales bacterium]